MVGQVFIIFGGDFSYFLEVPPRASGEIMMLDVIAEHEVRNIPPSNIIISLLTFNELVVFCDDVDSSRVRSD